MKLNLACGGNCLDGWRNHDIDVDITKMLPFARESVDFIILEHAIEHITTPQGVALLCEFHRVLKPGGVVRISFPDHEVLEGLTPEQMQRYLAFLRGAGVDATTPDDALNVMLTHWGHQSAWTSRLLLRVLRANGFLANPSSHGQSIYPELRGVDRHSPDVAELESSVVEAAKLLCAQST